MLFPGCNLATLQRLFGEGLYVATIKKIPIHVVTSDNIKLMVAGHIVNH
jgi:hypothetical protein